MKPHGLMAAGGRVVRRATAALRDPARRAEVPRKMVTKVRRAVAGGRPQQVEAKEARLPELPGHHDPALIIARPNLRVATILDDFSEMAFRYEWDQVRLTPQNWRTKLEEQQPDLLFVESVWKGHGNWWMPRGTGKPAREVIVELVTWCQERGVPTVFWNKEDPPNYDKFIATAKEFDYVFTVDADRIPHYERDLGHDRVKLLPFAAQPRVHNPVRRGLCRKHNVAFAGTYLREKYPERRKQTHLLLEPAVEHGLHIYSRTKDTNEKFGFPEPLDEHVVGTLPYTRMLDAYKGYKLFLNVNSVTQSPTMCARRLFELSACQTAVLSGEAASIERFFGDTITVVEDAEQARWALKSLVTQEQYRDRLALRAHRRVFDEHLYGHRVDEVLRTVGLPVEQRDDSISCVVPTMRPDELENVLSFMGSQTHRDRELVLVTHGFELDVEDVKAQAREHGLHDVTVVPAAKDLTLGACMNLGVDASSGRYVAKMDDDNYYGPNYLKDLVRVFSYTDAVVTGKWAHHVHFRSTGATLLRFNGSEHRFRDFVQGGTMLMPRDVAADLRFEDLPRRVDTTMLEKVRRDGGKIYSSDRFNFISMRGKDASTHTWTISDLEIMARSSKVLFYGDAVDHVTV